MYCSDMMQTFWCTLICNLHFIVFFVCAFSVLFVGISHDNADIFSQQCDKSDMNIWFLLFFFLHLVSFFCASKFIFLKERECKKIIGFDYYVDCNVFLRIYFFFWRKKICTFLLEKMLFFRTQHEKKWMQ